MKRMTFAAILCVAALVLSACGSSTNRSSASSTTGGFRNNSALRNRPLTPEAKLALGTIKLEGSSMAVDPAEAAKLLPLWQLMAQLNGSSSTAPQEVNAVLDQIQATMDPAQVKAIGGMQLTSSDIFAAFQQQSQSGGGLDPAGAAGTTSSSGSGGNGGGNRGGGGTFFFGGGGPGGGGFGGGFGANRTGTTTNGTGASTTNTAQAAQQASNQISLLVVNQLVRLLETRLKS